MLANVNLKDRVMKQNKSHKIALALKLATIAVALTFVVRGRPPAKAQYPDDKQHDAAIARLLDHDDQQKEINKETDERLNHISSVVDTMGGEMIGGFSLLTILTGLAAIFQLKGKKEA